MAVGFLEAQRDLGVEDESVAIVKMEVIEQIVIISHFPLLRVSCTPTHSRTLTCNVLYDSSRIERSPSVASVCKRHSMQ